MTLKEWRKINRYTQDAFAAALQGHVKSVKKLTQRTVGSWEKGVMPRPFWLKAVADFTHNKVTSKDFLLNYSPPVEKAHAQ